MPLSLPRTCVSLPTPLGHALFAIAAIVALAASARAQAVLGYGEDATAAPSGAIRIRLSNEWHRSDRHDVIDDTTYDIDRQLRASTIGLELGVLKRFSIGVTVPWVTTKSLAFVSSEHPRFLLDTLIDASHNGWGNVEALARVVWLGDPGQQGRFALRDGVHIRSTLVGGGYLGTGVMPNPTDPFNIAPSDRARVLVGESATDLMVGPHFFGSLVARYEKPMADNVLVAMHPSGNPYASDAVVFSAARKLGTRYEVEVTPRYQFGGYFAVGLQYRYHHGAQDQYTGQFSGTDNGGNPVTLDASTLDTATALTEQRVGFGVVYSAVESYTRNRSRIPVEVSLEYSKAVSISNNLPKEGRVVFAVRLFHRLWGKEFAAPVVPKTTPELEPAPSPTPPPATATPTPPATPPTT